MEHLYEIKHTKYFDPRTMFIIQTEIKLYLWIGDSIYFANKETYLYKLISINLKTIIRYLNSAKQYIKLLQENEKASQNYEIIEQNHEPKEFWSLWNKESDTKFACNKDWDSWFIDISKYVIHIS